ncbi:M4 family metallopeptidase [Candidatus Marithrix sp. Canyon 246]|uniref:M4 family metallopeptidase n=1 Tax=Candidatus Marithrix sp. Canyon 246 TaxID=1827136 RepID=UPI00084A2729|nr:M4 family metallopeptidase [Candidatus Marithrix sp. Canyon 246]
MNYLFIPLIIFSLSFTANADSLLEKMQSSFYQLNKTDNQRIIQNKPDRFQKPVRFRSDSILRNLNGSIRYISGKNLEAASKRSFRSIKARDLTTAVNFLKKNSSLLQIENPSKNFTMIKSTKDELTGGSRLRFEQSYQGLAIWPSEIGIHLNNNGNVTLMNGSYLNQQRRPFNVKPVVTADMAQEKALNGKPSNTKVSKKPELIIYLPDNDSSARLAWRLELEVSLDQKLMIIIDAFNADILTEFNQIHNAAITGSGVDLLGQTRPLNLFEENGQYLMVNTSKPMYDAATKKGVILVYDWMNNPDSEPFNAPLIRSNNPNIGFLPDAVSAAYNLSNTYDYYLERHQRNSLDGKAGDMVAIVRVGRNFKNAFWNGKAMFFGDGQPFAASLDVVAHELTHGVIQHTANLVYQNQSGALHEAFADIFGEMVEARQNSGKNDWLLGTQVGEIIRSMSRPEDHSQPSHMNNYQYLPNTEDGDNGGVHINNGIINHAYYLFAQSIGIKDAEKIFYRALTNHLLKNSQFVDARLAVLNSAKKLFGENSTQVQKAAEAFDKVGITANTASTPPPASFPSVQGEDALLFACLLQDGSVHVCRDEKPTDQQPIVLSQSTVAPTRIAVDGSGEMAAFITSQNDLCLIHTATGTEDCRHNPGTHHSVAMSPDGRYVAFVLLDANGQITPKITVVDMKADTEKTYKLYAPSDSKQPVYSIVAADSMTFNANGVLLYDALNQFSGADGRTFQNWAIYSLNVNTGAIQNVVEPDQGEDIGFPSLSKTSDNFLVFDVYKDQTKTLQVYTMNLNTGKFAKISEFQGQKSVPSYNGDDSAIVHMFPDSGVAFNTQLIRQPIAKDRITPQGQATTWLRGVSFGTVYRRGKFVGPQSYAAYFDVRTSILKINAITTQSGELRTFDMKLINGNPLTFQLINNQAATETDGLKATMEANNSIIIPRAELTELDGNTSYWKVNMNLEKTDTYVIPEGGLIPLQ